MGRVPENPTRPEAFLLTRTRPEPEKKFANPTRPEPEKLQTRPENPKKLEELYFFKNKSKTVHILVRIGFFQKKIFYHTRSFLFCLFFLVVFRK